MVKELFMPVYWWWIGGAGDDNLCQPALIQSTHFYPVQPHSTPDLGAQLRKHFVHFLPMVDLFGLAIVVWALGESGIIATQEAAPL